MGPILCFPEPTPAEKKPLTSPGTLLMTLA